MYVCVCVCVTVCVGVGVGVGVCWVVAVNSILTVGVPNSKWADKVDLMLDCLRN